MKMENLENGVIHVQLQCCAQFLNVYVHLVEHSKLDVTEMTPWNTKISLSQIIILI